MSQPTQFFLLPGTAGHIECALDLPESAPLGMAIVAHPHPLYGGTMDNKVVQTMARTLVSLGYATARLNFRGVGRSQGVHDKGRGETDDAALLLTYMKQQYPDLPVVLCGFSFGTYVVGQLNQRLAAEGQNVKRMMLVAVTAGKWNPPVVPANTIVVHGEEDDMIPLADAFKWARPHDIPITVIPACDHFFNHKLHHLRDILIDAFKF